MGSSQHVEILLIEDNPGDVVLIKKMLSSPGFKLRVVERLSQAVEQLGRPGIDILLLDLSLPDSQGLDTFVTVHACAQGRPIIVLSGLEDETRAIQAVHAGAQDYLTKAEVNSSSLTRSIRYALERGRLEKERTQILLREQTARAEAEAAQQRFLDLMNSIEGIVWEANVQTFEFIFVSRQAERVLGYPIERWLDERDFWRDHIHPDDRESAVNYRIQCTAERRSHEYEYRMLANDGSEVWLKDMVTLVVEEDQVIKLRGVMYDITDRKQVEVALQAFNETLERRVAERTEQVQSLATQLLHIEEQMRQRMAKVLHDDVQQLLYGARMHLKLLHEELSAEVVESVSTLLAQLDGIVAEALRVTRQLTGDLIPTLAKNLDLVQLLNRLARRKQELYGLTVTVEAEAVLPVLDSAVRTLLFQCVRELLFNVVKHAGVTEARIVVAWVGEEVRITVEDAGQGFAVDRLLQAEGGSERGSYGLAFVRDRLSWQGGRLEVDSRPGHGTRMTIRLPLADLEPR